MDLKDYIRTIPDFPKRGILFRDITTLFQHPQAFAHAVDMLAERCAATRPELVVGIEARGFVLGGAVATRLGVGFAPFRKKGKLPWKTISVDYQLEYGAEVMEAHEDALGDARRVLIVDDLIATGGTGVAAVQLIRRLGGEPCGFGAVIDLPDLGGAEAISAAGPKVVTLIEYAGH